MNALPQEPFLDDGDVRLYHGDVLDVLRALPAGVAQTCVTSPPYWGLRDYGTGEWTGGDADHEHDTVGARGGRGGSGAPGKQTAGAFPSVLSPDACSCGARRVDSQIGLEASPDLYVERMVGVFREVWRVLRDDGTVWLNLGDSYAGSGPSGASYQSETTKRRAEGNGQDGAFRVSPTLAERGLTYRDKKPHEIPSGLKPKDLVGIPWRVAFALQADGWYLRSDIVWSKPNPMPESVSDRPTKAHEYLFLLSKQPRYFYDADAIREAWAQDDARPFTGQTPYGAETNGKARQLGRGSRGDPVAGRNRRSVWTIPTEPFPEAHFATYPQALVRPCILAGSRPGDTVLDPFIGSGTTALVARNHGRHAIGIDLSADYLQIAARRLQQLSLLGGVA